MLAISQSRRAAVLFLMTALFLASSSCSGSSNVPPPPSPIKFAFDFNSGAQGWEGGAAEFPVSFEPRMGIQFGIRALPAPLDPTRSAFYTGGENLSDALFHFVKRRVDGLKPNTRYSLQFEVTFATSMADIPGDTNILNAGASVLEPNRKIIPLQGGDFYTMNLDLTKDAQKLGNLTKPNPQTVQYELKTLRSTAPFHVSSDNNGSLWLLLGVGSEFEVHTEIYYVTISMTASPA